jgi:hypothetical protein
LPPSLTCLLMTPGSGRVRVESIKGCLSLRTLDCSGIRMPAAALAQLPLLTRASFTLEGSSVAELSQCRHLTDLDLHVDDTSVGIGTLVHLRSLKLRWATASDVQEVLDCLPGLESLSILLNQPWDGLQFRRDFSQLRDFSFSCERMPAAAHVGNWLMSIARHAPALRTLLLHLSEPRKLPLALRCAFESFECLTDLTLWNVDVGVDMWCLQKCQELRYLRLGGRGGIAGLGVPFQDPVTRRPCRTPLLRLVIQSSMWRSPVLDHVKAHLTSVRHIEVASTNLSKKEKKELDAWLEQRRLLSLPPVAASAPTACADT